MSSLMQKNKNKNHYNNIWFKKLNLGSFIVGVQKQNDFMIFLQTNSTNNIMWKKIEWENLIN